MVDWQNNDSLRKVLVIGDITLPPSLGGAAGIAAKIRSLGGQVTLAGVVGKDEEGESLRRILNQMNIPCVLGVDTNRSMGIFHDILQVITVLMEEVKLVLISDHGKGVVRSELIATLCELCKVRNIPVLAVPFGSDFSKYQGVTVITPDFQSLEDLNGKRIQKMEDLEQAVENVFALTGCQACISAWSLPGGVNLFHSRKNWIHFPCPIGWKGMDIEELNNTFLAWLALGISQGLSLQSACKQAAAAAAAGPS